MVTAVITDEVAVITNERVEEVAKWVYLPQQERFLSEGQPSSAYWYSIHEAPEMSQPEFRTRVAQIITNELRCPESPPFALGCTEDTIGWMIVITITK